MKKEVESSKAKWLVEPGCVVMVTSGDTYDRSEKEKRPIGERLMFFLMGDWTENANTIIICSSDVSS